MITTFLTIQAFVVVACIIAFAIKGAFGGNESTKCNWDFEPYKVKNGDSDCGWFYVRSAGKTSDGLVYKAIIVDYFGKVEETVVATSADGLEKEILKGYHMLQNRSEYIHP